ncbi:MAG TPA: hypothetical protein PLF99_10215, partial [Tenuifilaceae bacterium]|nr:hypothetical protein [Tenuifilaceae bacterium]
LGGDNAVVIALAGGSLRQARAMTTALSPPSRMSMMMIWPSASQNSGDAKKSIKAIDKLGNTAEQTIRFYVE